MGQFDRREPSYLDIIHAILDLSLGGISRTCIGQITRCVGYPRRLDPYFDFVSKRGLAYVTENYCETTAAGARYLQGYQELANYLKVDSGNKIVLSLIKIFDF